MRKDYKNFKQRLPNLKNFKNYHYPCVVGHLGYMIDRRSCKIELALIKWTMRMIKRNSISTTIDGRSMSGISKNKLRKQRNSKEFNLKKLALVISGQSELLSSIWLRMMSTMIGLIRTWRLIQLPRPLPTSTKIKCIIGTCQWMVWMIFWIAKKPELARFKGSWVIIILRDLHQLVTFKLRRIKQLSKSIWKIVRKQM